MLDDAEVQAQFVAVAQRDQRRGLHIGFLGQPRVEQDHTLALDGRPLDGGIHEVHHEAVKVLSARGCGLDHGAHQRHGRGGQRADRVEVIDRIALFLQGVEQDMPDDRRPAVVEGHAREFAERLVPHGLDQQALELFARLQHLERGRRRGGGSGRCGSGGSFGLGRGWSGAGFAESFLFGHASSLSFRLVKQHFRMRLGCEAGARPARGRRTVRYWPRSRRSTGPCAGSLMRTCELSVHEI